MNEEEIRNIMAYHRVGSGETLDAMKDVREIMTEATVAVAALLPPSRERSMFITHMQEGLGNANGALAIHGRASDA